MNKLASTYLQPSNLNTDFNCENLPFEQYIEKMRAVIAQARTDLNSADQQMIIDANSPAEYVPPRPSQCGSAALITIRRYHTDLGNMAQTISQYIKTRGRHPIIITYQNMHSGFFNSQMWLIAHSIDKAPRCDTRNQWSEHLQM